MSIAASSGRAARRPLPGQLRVEALVWLALARGLLWIRPYLEARNMLTALSSRMPYRGTSMGVGPIALRGAIRAASQVIPHASCLPQALVAELLLQRAGRPSQVFLAGTRGGRSGFYAHAWVESAGHVVVGGGPGTHAVLGAIACPGPDLQAEKSTIQAEESSK